MEQKQEGGGDPVSVRRAVLGGGLVMAGAGALLAARPAQAAGAEPGWQAAREAQDAWLDKPGVRHRLLLDTTTPAAAAGCLNYATTFYTSNQSGYGLGPETLGVVVVLRHFATPFGYNDRIWARYGAQFVEKLKLTGDMAQRGPKGNPLLHAAESAAPTKGADEAPTLSTLQARGVHFAVCAAAGTHFAHMLAGSDASAAAAIEDELKANLIPGGVLVASGVVAVNRGQERGYALVSVVE
jgi:intracellular sulfur oxidation DsrE/DsrF family protein